MHSHYRLDLQIVVLIGRVNFVTAKCHIALSWSDGLWSHQLEHEEKPRTSSRRFRKLAMACVSSSKIHECKWFPLVFRSFFNHSSSKTIRWCSLWFLNIHSEELPNDIQTAVSQKIQQCANQNPQMIMCVVSNNQGDRYATIKKRCYLDFGIPSQVMVHKTITPKDKTKGIGGLMSVATKVAIQMNAKLGGLPWWV